MEKTILHLSLKLWGPLLTQSSNPGELGLDLVVARNHKDKSYLPGSLISGKIRQALEELNDATKDVDKPDWFAPEIDDWFGKESNHNFAIRKRLYVADFILEETLKSNTRYRIKIDPDRGAVEQHQLLMIESPFVSGELYTFSGEIHFFSSEKKATSITQHIEAAIKWFSHLGALKSIGFGQVKNAEIIDIETLTIPTPEIINTTPDKIGFRLQPRFPFCLAGKPNADNLFDSEIIISGGTIKGCIANTWNQLLDLQQGRIDKGNEYSDFAELRENFSQLRISHAFPGLEKNKRPVVAPLSIVTTTEGKELNKTSNYYDVAQLTTPGLIDNQAPEFSVDWKDTEDTISSYPWPYIRFKNWGWDECHSELRVHAAIDRRTGRSAENKLFAYEQVIPDDNQWYGELDLTEIKNKSKVLSQLKALCQHGVIGLGKTKTPVTIHFTEPIDPVIESNLTPLNNGLWLITLQTDTLLGSPEKLDESSGKAELQDMYEQAWAEISNNKLTLVRYFARQRITGGRFRQKIMQKSELRGEENYHPWLLTEAGSVFVLQASKQSYETEIMEVLNDWLKKGLPLTKSTKRWYGLGDDPQQHWGKTPFVPENGYGEIAINLQADNITRLKDTDQNVTAINLIDTINNGEIV